MLKNPRLHEIVITKSKTQVLDIGFVDEVAPLRIQARHHAYQSDNPPYYGGVEYTNWQHTGVYTTEEQWRKLTKNTPTDKVCEILKKQLEAFQDEKEPDFDEWWENLDDIEREEYNRWCQESELE